MSEKRCEHCVHYRVKLFRGVACLGELKATPLCTLGRKLEPCEFFEREVGADDE